MEYVRGSLRLELDAEALATQGFIIYPSVIPVGNRRRGLRANLCNVPDDALRARPLHRALGQHVAVVAPSALLTAKTNTACPSSVHVPCRKPGIPTLPSAIAGTRARNSSRSNGSIFHTPITAHMSEPLRRTKNTKGRVKRHTTRRNRKLNLTDLQAGLVNQLCEAWSIRRTLAACRHATARRARSLEPNADTDARAGGFVMPMPAREDMHFHREDVVQNLVRLGYPQLAERARRRNYPRTSTAFRPPPGAQRVGISVDDLISRRGLSP